ncbi:MAG: MBL fold metallo-hydrolase [Chthoniobacterales bacterium]|nr:MBL fold metallo-hydrolase [Chthoniobacterales bacterium]
MFGFLHLGGELGIGANSYLLRTPRGTFLLDAGMHPKKVGASSAPEFGLLEGMEAPLAAFVTHAHQDHVGCLPMFTRAFPECPVFMTPETLALSDIMLHNSVNVMLREQEASREGEVLLYSHRSVELSRRQWRAQSYGVKFNVTGERGGGGDMEFCFYPAGHVLGSAGVFFRIDDIRVFYTGDVHFGGQTLLRAAEFPDIEVDCLIMEATRGDTQWSEERARERQKARLGELIREAFSDGGCVTMPVFALGKTQEVLGLIWELRREGAIPPGPVYIGGLGAKFTAVYDAASRSEERLHPGLRLLEQVGPLVATGADAHGLQPRRRCIYALSSGMLTERTVSNLFVRKILGDPVQRLVFVGDRDPESPAGRVRAAKEGEEVMLDEAMPPVRKRCRVDELDFSSHASRESLVEFAKRMRPRVVLLVHGDVPAMEWFRVELEGAMPWARVVIPQPREWVEFE